MSTPRDQSERDRFIQELDRNFSVVASAGSGKTRAITDRIVALARHERACKWLPALVVVTYTNRAAAEMQQRARQSILEAGLSLEVLTAFNRAFFGTIHSLCVKLLRQHGHHIGVPVPFEHVDEGDDAALWTEFIQRSDRIAERLDPAQRQALLRLTPVRHLLELGHRGTIIANAPPPGPFPTFDFSTIYSFVPSRKNSEATVARSQEALRRWEAAWQGDGFVGPLPDCESTPLQTTWETALAPIIEWRQRAALQVASEISEAYRDFRLSRGILTFADQVALAAELLRHPEAARRIRAREYRVILDEAQDTDPAQFDVLLELSRPPEATGSWLQDLSAPPRPGHFCMVGDFQQSIYGARADLAHYRKIHNSLIDSGAGEAVTFAVTFRLDEAALGFVDTVFPALLHNKDQQVEFVELLPRPTALPGQIVRFDPEVKLEEMANKNLWQKMYWEAEKVAQWLRTAGLKNLRASSWSEVAILCPRVRWLAPMRAALRSAGLDAQVQSERAIKGDSPAYAWFTALATVLAEPRNAYEVVGVLREVFGLSDHDLAAFSEGHGERFQLVAANTWGGPVSETLNLLTALRERMQSMALYSALEEMVRTVRLRDRLLALPASDFDHLEHELEELLTQAAAAEAAKATLQSFASGLQSAFHASRDIRGSVRDAVQIISGHKAKGSEWEAVILPFFARGISVGKSPFPRFLRDPRTSRMTVALDGHDIDAELKDKLDTQERQELERLLYVSLTRAKHTLVLVDDRRIFRGKTDLPSKAQAKLLLLGDDAANVAAFERLPTELTPCAKTAAHQSAKSATRSEETVLPLQPLSTTILRPARDRATRFLKRNPSALAEAALAEADPAAYAEMTRRTRRAPNLGQLYGTWWHGFVEHLDWTGPQAEWEAAFQKKFVESPDPERSQREWALLREQLLNGSDLARILTTPSSVAQAEMPLLWAISDRECLDGIIDLAVFQPAENRWCILDWKTNRVQPGKVAELRTHYLPQLSAYWKAASEMLQLPITVGLYSTMTGDWLPYDSTELAAAWKKLERNSAALAKALEDDRDDQ